MATDTGFANLVTSKGSRRRRRGLFAGALGLGSAANSAAPDIVTVAGVGTGTAAGSILARNPLISMSASPPWGGGREPVTRSSSSGGLIGGRRRSAGRDGRRRDQGDRDAVTTAADGAKADLRNRLEGAYDRRAQSMSDGLDANALIYRSTDDTPRPEALSR